MSEQAYEYIISGYHQSRFKYELAALGITTDLVRIEFTEPDHLAVVFADGLSQEHSDALDAMVAAHSGEPMVRHDYKCLNCGEDGYTLDLNDTPPSNCPSCGSEKIIDKQNTSLVIDTISIVSRKQTKSDATPQVADPIPVDADLYPEGVTVRTMALGKQRNGGTGTVKLYDVTNDQVLGTIDFTESVATPKKITLSNFPTEGLCVIEAQFYTDGTGDFDLYNVKLEVY
jgi:DNA-directed RNA polymerase subunit RPC12/RpoP